MTEDIAISIEKVSKAYRIWESPAARIVSPLQDGLAGFLPAGSAPAQYLKRRATSRYKDFYALRDISFQVRRGEAVGIIGRNGSGKSTLLQIIAGILQPTAGRTQVFGRVAALLELGAGFNGDYSGRENVHLNGAVLGLSPAEIHAKFDRIAAYADIGEFIDQPVRTYSTGMQMRLAFAVAAHVDADLLIIDEALGVGDARFQLKCAKTIDSLVDSGKTLLFVSHDFSSVKRLCQRAVLIEKGRLLLDDEPNRVVNHYTKLLAEPDAVSPPSHKATPAKIAEHSSAAVKPASPVGELTRLAEAQQALARLAAAPPLLQKLKLVAEADKVEPEAARGAEFCYGGELGRIEDIQILDKDGEASFVFLTGEPATARFVASANEHVPGSIYAVTVKNTLGQDVYVTNTLYRGIETPDLSANQKHQVSFVLHLNLMPGEYFLSFGWVVHAGDTLLVIHRRYDAVKLQILPVDRCIGIANLHSQINVTLLP